MGGVPYHSITVAFKVDAFEESNKTNSTFLKKQHQNLKDFLMMVIPWKFSTDSQCEISSTSMCLDIEMSQTSAVIFRFFFSTFYTSRLLMSNQIFTT